MKSTIRIATAVAAGALTVAGLTACVPEKVCGGGGDGACSPTTASPTNPDPTTTYVQPVLGLTGMGGLYPNARGFGTARPALIDNGGDPTGLVSGITWQSWGGTTADGVGKSTYVPPGEAVAAGTTEKVRIRAYDLTTCDGRLAYEHVTWWFPSEGQTYQWARTHHIENYDLCGRS